jgi:hypothetical protein
MITRNSKPILQGESPSPAQDKPSMIVIKRKGSHVQFMRRGNVIFLPAIYIREHYSEVEKVDPKRVV